MKTHTIDNEEREPILKIEDGDRIIIPRHIHNFYHKCCECGLEHRVFIKHDKTKLILKFNRI